MNKHAHTGPAVVYGLPIVFSGPRNFAGLHQIIGTTKNEADPDLPVSRLVRLSDQASGLPVRELWSDPVTGYYAFTFIASGVYCVSAFDHTLEFESELEAYVQSEPMS